VTALFALYYQTWCAADSEIERIPLNPPNEVAPGERDTCRKSLSVSLQQRAEKMMPPRARSNKIRQSEREKREWKNAVRALVLLRELQVGRQLSEAAL
jgi:hypothetical protein